jgi:hypothetical protein
VRNIYLASRCLSPYPQAKHQRSHVFAHMCERVPLAITVRNPVPRALARTVIAPRGTLSRRNNNHCQNLPPRSKVRPRGGWAMNRALKAYPAMGIEMARRRRSRKRPCIGHWCLTTIMVLSMVLPTSSARAEGPSKQQCVVANEEAQDLRQAGRLREARVRLSICIAESCPLPVRQDCAERLSEVDKATPTLTISAVDSDGRNVSALGVTMDGLRVVGMFGVEATPIDPGEHHFVLEAAGVATVERTIAIREGEKGRTERVVLNRLNRASPTPSTVTGQLSIVQKETYGQVVQSRQRLLDSAELRRLAGDSNEPIAKQGLIDAPSTIGDRPIDRQSDVDRPVSDADQGAPSSPELLVGRRQGLASQQWLGLALGSVGAIGVFTGSVLGVAAKATYDQGDIRGAYDQAAASTASFLAGAALLGAGVFLYCSAPSRPVTMTVSAAPTGAALALRGRW